MTRPSCWTDGEPTARAPAFHDRGRSCAQGRDPALAAKALELTPGCRGCSRLRRALDIRAGMAQAEKPLRRVRAGSRPAPETGDAGRGGRADG